MRGSFNPATLLWAAAIILLAVLGYGWLGPGRSGDEPHLPVVLSPRPPDRPPPSPPPRRDAAGPHPRSSADSPATGPVEPPGFSPVSVAVAERQLGGPVRFLVGFTPEHLEAGPATAVPGAVPGLEVIRAVYRLADGNVVLLDQQRMPRETTTAPPTDDPERGSGETAYGTSPDGVSVATWVEADGYYLALAARMSLDSLRLLRNQVH